MVSPNYMALGRYYLVQQYRYAIRARSWEFPQGGCEEAADLRRCAERELREELGLSAADWLSLGKLWLAVGNSNQGFEVFLALRLRTGQQMLDESEADLVWQTFSEEEISDMIANGGIRSSVTISAFYLVRSCGSRSEIKPCGR
jgi:8-oxo-dGTP pyrophosphatase MutT (NUDIX family)